MHRPRSRRWLALAPILSLALGCKSSSGGAPPGSPDGAVAMTRAAVAAALGTCAVDVYKAFATAADELAAAATVLSADGAEAQRLAARAAWIKAMGLWQEAEVFQFGPAGPRMGPRGQGIRDEVYSWPLVSRCLIEQQIVAKGYEAPTFGKDLVNVRGLDALEYLLFHTGNDNACGPAVAINSAGTWAAIPADELDRRKRAYAAVVAADVATWAKALVDAWDPAKGNFLRETMTAGAGSTVYKTSQLALNAMSDALFYVERPVKDVKLARPLGLKDCTTPPCLEALESRFALRSKDHLRRNLDGFEKLAFGCAAPAGTEPLGFDDLLMTVGATDLATRLRTQAAAARQALDDLPGDDLRDALMQEPMRVRRIYDAFQALVTPLKTEVTGILDLEVPKAVEGDND